MQSEEKTLDKIICNQVVNDYFTPNIKAEVILDTLLTPYISQIVKDQIGEQVGELTWLTKEMSILENGSSDDRGAKIDYVLAGQEKVYLVELKTTDSSLDYAQADDYLKNCQGKVFGEVLGKRLLSILEKSFHVTLENKQDCHSLEELWSMIWEKRERYDPAGSAGEVPQTASTYAEKARWLIKIKGWAQRKNLRSRKYLYTLGQLLDCRNQSFWTNPMEVLYLTPDGNGPKNFKALSLKAFADNHADSSDPYMALLSDILGKIYGDN